MTDQDKEYLRDLFAGFAAVGRSFEYKEIEAKECYAIADALLEAREQQETIGLPAIKRKRTK